MSPSTVAPKKPSSSFADTIIQWQKVHGRHHLPWQQPLSAYNVWISEIMLQQTQVTTVIPYYERFMASFPDVKTLAAASEDRVLAHWSGLGYYRRAKNLHKAAKIITNAHQGCVPTDPEILITLPGIGLSTAHAVASIAGERPFPILDANVKRVLVRYFAVDKPVNTSASEKELWQLAGTLMPPTQCRTYTQGMMDLGALICAKKPLCSQCPLQTDCQAQLLGIQHKLPIKTVKKPRPTHEKTYLIYTKPHHIWLQQRPDQGVWPKLWCLPEVDVSESPASKNIPLTIVKHSFSHYHLIMHPVVVSGCPRAYTPGAWFRMDEAYELGLPSPIRRIITGYLSEYAAQIEESLL